MAKDKQVVKRKGLIWASTLAILAAPSIAAAQLCDSCDCNLSPDCTSAPSYEFLPYDVMQPQMSEPPTPDDGSSDADSPIANDAAIDQAFSSAPSLAFSERGSAFTGPTFAALGAPGGYIEPAFIRSNFRFRFDAAYDFDRPDRAEFYYTTWQLFGGQNPNPPNGFPDPEIDRQELSVYYEHAFSNQFSVYANVPFVFSDPLRNPNVSGVGDMQAGFKLSLWSDCDQQLTFRLNNYIPTADADERWVGTGHYSIEPGLLYTANLSDGWTLQAEVRDWIAIGGADDYAGNVLRYGVGLGYDWFEGCRYRVTPVVEAVGWSVLDGQVFDFDDDAVDPTNVNIAAGDIGPIDASGDTIVNLKIGARIANYCGGSFYGGYGHSLTGDRWYRDIFRLEYRRMF